MASRATRPQSRPRDGELHHGVRESLKHCQRPKAIETRLTVSKGASGHTHISREPCQLCHHGAFSGSEPLLPHLCPMSVL